MTWYTQKRRQKAFTEGRREGGREGRRERERGEAEREGGRGREERRVRELKASEPRRREGKTWEEGVQYYCCIYRYLLLPSHVI